MHKLRLNNVLVKSHIECAVRVPHCKLKYPNSTGE